MLVSRKTHLSPQHQSIPVLKPEMAKGHSLSCPSPHCPGFGHSEYPKASNCPICSVSVSVQWNGCRDSAPEKPLGDSRENWPLWCNHSWKNIPWVFCKAIDILISFILLTSCAMWLNLLGVTSAQFVPLIERLDVTYFPTDCLQSASRSKLQSFLIGCSSKSCPRCTWAGFSMCHSFLLSWHFHLVISDGLGQAKRSRCTCAWCVPPREPRYKWSSYLPPSQSTWQRNYRFHVK